MSRDTKGIGPDEKVVVLKHDPEQTDIETLHLPFREDVLATYRYRTKDGTIFKFKDEAIEYQKSQTILELKDSEDETGL